MSTAQRHDPQAATPAVEISALPVAETQRDDPEETTEETPPASDNISYVTPPQRLATILVTPSPSPPGDTCETSSNPDAEGRGEDDEPPLVLPQPAPTHRRPAGRSTRAATMPGALENPRKDCDLHANAPDMAQSGMGSGLARKTSRKDAIRAKCADCAETPTERINCAFGPTAEEPCPLWPFRNPTAARGSGSRKKAVQEYGRRCSCNSPAERMACPADDCPLHFFCTRRPTGASARGRCAE